MSRAGALRLIWPFIARYTWAGLGATVALLASAGLVLALGQGLRRLIDGGFASGSQAQLNATALGMSGIIVLLALATGARFALVTWLGERIGADLRRAVFDHVIALSPAWFETARTGDVLSRLQADTAVLQALAGSALSQWLRSALLLVGAFAMLVVTSPLLAGVVAAVVPFVVVPLVVFCPAGAPPLPRGAGTHRRFGRAGGGDAGRPAHGAGVHAGAVRPRPLRHCDGAAPLRLPAPASRRAPG